MAPKDLSKGVLITFEGPEGSGKSTQVRLLCNYLRRLRFTVLQLREPGGTVIGEQIRRILLDPRNQDMDIACEMLLYQAARAQLVKERVLTALRQKEIVVLDRFLDATVCYQGLAAGLDPEMIRRIGRLVTYGLKPDLTILLDIEAERGLRKSGRRDRIERRPLAFHRRVRRGYLKLAREHPRRIKIVRLNKSIARTQTAVRRLVDYTVASSGLLPRDD